VGQLAVFVGCIFFIYFDGASGKMFEKVSVGRRFGRTAYHLMETIQMGFIPIYVYSDEPWVPYAALFPAVGFVANLATVPSALKAVPCHPQNAFLGPLKTPNACPHPLIPSFPSPCALNSACVYAWLGQQTPSPLAQKHEASASTFVGSLPTTLDPSACFLVCG